MKDLAPHLTRRRLLIEGFFSKEVNEETIRDYFAKIANTLELKGAGDAIVTKGSVGTDNQGYGAGVQFVDFGILLNSWTSTRFFSISFCSRKLFDEKKVIEATREFFGTYKIESMTF